MAAELRLVFPDAGRVEVSLHQDGVAEDMPAQLFAPPLDPTTRAELGWYLETYPVHYMTEEDDERARGIAGRLKTYGAALFEAAFSDPGARRLFNRFQDLDDAERALTVSSLHPAVLAQPWELLCDPAGTFLFLETPRISIRRRLPAAGRAPRRARPKPTAHLLFVVSRPDDSGLIDPRADPQAVMDALDAAAPGRVTVEFLRPPTRAALIERLNDGAKPAIDILHFDGHGAYADNPGQPGYKAGGSDLVKDGGQGFLAFEDAAHQTDLVPAEMLGDLLQRKQVGLVVLSACQSAMVSGKDALGSVAPRLIRAGIPSVLAMTQSVLVATTEALSRHLYRRLAAGHPIGAALDYARTQLYAERGRGERQRGAGTITLELQDWFVPALYQGGAE